MGRGPVVFEGSVVDTRPWIVRVREFLLRLEPWWSLIVGAAAAFLVLPLLSYPFGWDQSVFGTVADTMRHGGVVYRDAWEHKPPGVYYVYSLAFALFGRDYWGVRILEIVAVAVTAGMLVEIARRRLGTTLGGVIAGLSYPLLYLLIGPNTAQPESYQVPFLVGGLWCWPRPSDSSRVGARCFWSGVLVSSAVLFKPPIILFPLLLLLDRWWIDWGRPGWRGRAGLSLVTAGGLAAPVLAVFLYYGARGAFWETLDALVLFPATYSAYNPGPFANTQWSGAVEWTKALLSFYSGLLILLGVIRGGFRRGGEVARWALCLLAAWASLVLQRKYFDYQHIPLLPFLALGFALPFTARSPEVPAPSDPSDQRSAAFLSAAAALVFIVAVEYGQGARRSWTRWPTVARLAIPEGDLPERGSEGQDLEVVQWIRANSAPDESLFVWGNRPGLYFQSNRRMAGPYAHLLAALPPWGEPERLSRLIRRLDRERPRIIVIALGDSCWWQTRGAKDLIGERPEFRSFVQDTYSFVRRIGTYELWRLPESALQPEHRNQERTAEQ